MAEFKVRMYTPGKSMANQYYTIDADQVGSVEARRKICVAGAEVLLQRLREHLKRTTRDPNAAIRGTLAASLKLKENADGSVIVSPRGKHHGKGVGKKTRDAGYHRPKKGQGISLKSPERKKHHGMTNAVSAVDVGYYLEYGRPGMTAEHWMQTTLENSEDEVLEAMQNAWNEHLENLGF